MIKCDLCKQTGKGRYKTTYFEDRLITLCDECRYGKNIKRAAKSNDEMFNYLQTPFWKILGLKPKEREIKLDKYLKSRGMTYGDWRREREYKSAKHESAYSQFQNHVNKYGTGNAPETPFTKKD
jgi:hypothetical protein